VILIHGGAPGADTLAGQIGVELGFIIECHPAEWDKYGKAAGPKRNIEMLEREPDLVLAFHKDLNESRGTAHTVREAFKRGMRVFTYPISQSRSKKETSS